MTDVQGVYDVHDLHCWSITTGMYALSCHAFVDILPPSQSASTLRTLETMLAENYQIRHATIQFECHSHQDQYCFVDGLYCRMEMAHKKSDHKHAYVRMKEQARNEQKGRHS
jgi:cobalt-zinc-cadmium efflux system protein